MHKKHMGINGIRLKKHDKSSKKHKYWLRMEKGTKVLTVEMK